MTTFILRLVIMMLIVLAEQVFGIESKIPPSLPAKPLPIFQPRNLGTPKVRVSGGVRGDNQSEVALTVLAPEQAGFTTKNQPVLYWQISKPVQKPIEITVTDKVSVLLKLTLNGITKAGIQAVKLADYNTRLLPETSYKWSVAIVNNPKQRSADIFTSAGIRLIPESRELKNRLSFADDKERILIYAQEGIWYDALAAIQILADKMPNNSLPVAMRASLLEQVGLFQ
jgi:hypothetical protein